jgi:hypothetical protein
MKTNLRNIDIVTTWVMNKEASDDAYLVKEFARSTSSPD